MRACFGDFCIIPFMKQETLSHLRERLRDALPKTPGEKMVAGSLGIDAIFYSSIAILKHLQQQGAIQLTPVEHEAILNAAVYGGKILISDIFLRTGGLIRMLTKEDNNWFVHTKSGHEQRKEQTFIQVDPQEVDLSDTNFADGLVLKIGPKSLLPALNVPIVQEFMLAVYERRYPDVLKNIAQQHQLSVEESRDFLRRHLATMVDINTRFANGALNGTIVRLPEE